MADNLLGFDNNAMDVSQALELRNSQVLPQEDMLGDFIKQNPPQTVNVNVPAMTPNILGDTENSTKDLSDVGKVFEDILNQAPTQTTYQPTDVLNTNIPDDFWGKRFDQYYLGENNEDIAASKQSAAQKIANGFGRAISSGSRAFLQGTAGVLYDTGAAVFNVDGDSFFDNDLNKAFETWGKAEDDYLPLFQDEAGKDKWVTANKVGHLVEMIGFMGGMGLAAWATEGLGSSINTGLLAGKLSLGAKFTAAYDEATVAFSKVSYDLAQVAKLDQQGEVAAQYAKQIARDIAAISKKPIPESYKLAEVTKLLETTQLELAKKYTRNVGIYNWGRQTFYGALGNLGLSASMGLEAKSSFVENAIAKRESEGYTLSEEDKAKMDEYGTSLGRWVTGATGILGAVSFSHMLKGVVTKGAQEAAYKDIINGIVEKEGVFAEKQLFQTGEKGVLNTAKNVANKVYNATTAVGKNIYDPWGALTLAEFSIIPGAFQGMYATKMDNYFNSKHEVSDAAILGEKLVDSLVNTFTTNEGITELIIGGLAPGLLHIKSNLEKSKQINTNTKEAVTALNIGKLSPFLKDMADSIKTGGAMNLQELHAIKTNDKVLEHDARIQRLIAYVFPRVKYDLQSVLKREIDSYRTLSSTPEGIKQLQAEGVIPDVGDIETLRQKFNNDLNDIEQYAKDMSKYYSAAKLRYGADKAFTPQIFEKLVYLSTMTDNAAKRVKSMYADLQASNELPESIKRDITKLESLLHDPRQSPEVLQELAGSIGKNIGVDNLSKKIRGRSEIAKLKDKIDNAIKGLKNEIDKDKQDVLLAKVNDIIRVTNDKIVHLKRYNEIVSNPSGEVEVTESIDLGAKTNNTLGAQPVKEGTGQFIKLIHRGSNQTDRTVKGQPVYEPSDIELGVEYIAGDRKVPISFGNVSKLRSEFSKFRIEEERTVTSKNGKFSYKEIRISTLAEDGVTRKDMWVKADIFKNYKLSRLSDLDMKNPTAAFYVTHANDVFTYEFQKNNPEAIREGLLEYNKDTNQLEFLYRGKDGKEHRRNVSLEDIKSEKLKFKEKGKRLTDAEFEYIKDFNDPNKAENLKRHLEIVNDLVEEKKQTLERLTEKKNEFLKDIEETKKEIEEFQKRIDETTNGKKRYITTQLKNIKIHSEIIDSYTESIAELEAEQEQLTYELEVINDTLNNQKLLRESAIGIVEQLTVNKSRLEKILENVKDSIQGFKDAITKAKETVYMAVNGFKDMWDKFISKYPNETQGLDMSNSAIQEFIDAETSLNNEVFDADAITFSDGLSKVLPELKEIQATINEVTDFSIKDLESKVEKTKQDLVDAEKRIKKGLAMIKANQELIDAFQKEHIRWWKEDLLADAFRKSPSVRNSLREMQKQFNVNSGTVGSRTMTDANDTEVLEEIKKFARMKGLQNNPFSDSVIVDDVHRDTKFYKKHNNWADRARQFVFNISNWGFEIKPGKFKDVKIDQNNLGVIIVNHNNQEKLGFKGLIEDSYESASSTDENPVIINNTGENRDNELATIGLVYTYKDTSGREVQMYTLDVDGNLHSKIDSDGTVQNLDEIAFTYLDTASLIRRGLFKAGENKFYDKDQYTEEELNEYHKQAIEERAKLLDIDGVDFRQFDVKGGFINKKRLGQDTVRNESIVELGLVTEKDLDTNTDIIAVATQKDPSNEKMAIVGGTKLPVGLAYLNSKRGDPVILNTSRFREEEAINIYNLFKRMSAIMFDSFSTNEADVEENATQRLTTLKEQKELATIKKYLQTILFMDSPSKIQKKTRNNVYFNDSNELVIGNGTTYKPTFKFDPKSLADPTNREKIITLIGGTENTPGLFYNANSVALKTGTEKFVELKSDGENPAEEIVWNSLNSFYASNKNPDGSKRTNIPLTVNADVPTKGKIGDVPIEGKYIKITGFTEALLPKQKVEVKEEVKTPVNNVVETKSGIEDVTITMYKKPVNIKFGEKVEIDLGVSEDNIKLSTEFIVNKTSNGDIEIKDLNRPFGEEGSEERKKYEDLSNLIKTRVKEQLSKQPVKEEVATKPGITHTSKRGEFNFPFGEVVNYNKHNIVITKENGELKFDIKLDEKNQDPLSSLSSEEIAGLSNEEKENLIIASKKFTKDFTENFINAVKEKGKEYGTTEPEVKEMKTTVEPVAETVEPTIVAEKPVETLTGNDAIRAKIAEKLNKQKNNAVKNNTRIIQEGETKNSTIEEEQRFKTFLENNLPQIQPNEVDDVIKIIGTNKTAWGTAKGHVITLVKGAPTKAKYHEAFHPVLDVLVTDREWKDISKEFRNRQGGYYDLASNTFIQYKDATDYQIKDAMSEEMGDYMTTGILPNIPGVKGNIFQRMWNAIKSIFRNQTTINSLYEGVNEGKFKDRKIQRESDALNYNTMRKLNEKFKEATIRDNVTGIASELFKQLRRNPTWLVEAAEGKFDFDAMLENVKDMFDQQFLDLHENGEFTIVGNENYTEQQVTDYSENWLDVRDNWADYKKEIIDYLKSRKLEVKNNTIENGVDSEKESKGDSSNSREYGASILSIDPYANASLEIKLLFKFLTLDKFPDKNGKENPLNITNDNLLDVPLAESSTGMDVIDNNNTYFWKVMAELANTNSLEEKELKLLKLARKHPPLVKIYKSIFGQPGATNNDISPEQLKLRLAFGKTFDLQAPIALIETIQEDGTSIIFNANKDQDTNTVLSNFYSKMSSLYGTGLVVLDANDNYVYPEKIHDVLKSAPHNVTQPKEKTSALKFLNTIGFDFPSTVFDKLNIEDQKAVVTEAGRLYAELSKVKSKGNSISRSGFDTNAVDALSALYVKAEGSFVSSQRNNIEGSSVQKYVKQNFISKTLSIINNAFNREAVLDKRPWYRTSSFTQNSRLLMEGGMWFDENGKWKKDVKMKPSLIEGISSDGEKKPISKMNKITRFLQSFNLNLSGSYSNVSNADAATEWGTELGENAQNYFTPSDVKNNRTKSIKEIYSGYLKDEINLIKDFQTSNALRRNGQLNKKVGNYKVGEKLRFFKDILEPELVEKIEKYANEKEIQSTDAFVKEIEKEFTEQVEKYFDTLNKEQRNFLEESGVIIEKGDTGLYNFIGLNKDVPTKLGLGTVKTENTATAYNVSKLYFKSHEIDEIIDFRTLNAFTHNIELHKVFFGDPAVQKDPFKRFKLFMSGKDFTHVDNGESNVNLVSSNIYNKVGNYKLGKNDVGYTEFSDTLRIFTHADTIMISPNWKTLPEQYQNIKAEDAQSRVALNFYRESMIKQTKWSDAREAQYQYDNALFRQAALDRFNAGDKRFEKYVMNADLKIENDKILAKGNPNVENAFYITKDMGVGILNGVDMIPFALKTSSFPLSWELAEGLGLENLYLSMLDSKAHYAGPLTQMKIGSMDNLPGLYDENTGVISIVPDTINNFAQEISKQDMGTIVETSGEKDKQTLGSQTAKLDTLNLLDKGVPVDFLPNETNRESKWNNLSSEDKMKNKFYKFYTIKNKVLTALANKGFDNMIDKIGIIKKENGYELLDAEKLTGFLKEEIVRRELPKNMQDALDVYFDVNSGEVKMKNALETLANFNQLKSIINSLVDKNITAPKISGKPLIMVSSVGFESDGIKVENVNGEKRFVATRLKFYEKGEDGNTKPMEILTTNPWKKQMKASGLTEGELFRHLQTKEGREILKGIGFRIPTQGLNSIDSFEIVPFKVIKNEDGSINYEKSKFFVPDTYGDMVVVPAEIVTKTGGDFDVDKLNSYLKNIYIDKDGYPRVVKFIEDTTDRKSLERLYKATYSKKEISEIASGKLIGDIMQGDAEIIPTLEEFIANNTGKDPYELNSQEAIENYYQDNISNILLTPENFDQLIAPNSAKQLEDYDADITKLKGENKSTRAKDDLNYTDLANPLTINTIRQNMLDGKNQVGVGAQSNTGNAIAQSQPKPIVINPYEIVWTDADAAKIPVDKNGKKDYEIKFEHNQIVKQIDDKTKFLATISGQKAGKQNISELISEVIDGAVDAANNPFLMSLFPNKDALSTALLLFRTGVKDPYDVILFANQPILAELFKQQAIVENTRLYDPSYRKSNEAVYEELFDKYKNGAEIFIDKFDQKDLIDNIKKGANANQAYQRAVLREYRKYKLYADHLLDIQIATSWDTLDNPSKSSVYLKEQQFEATKQGNVFGSAENMLKGNFIGNRKERLQDSIEALDTVYLPITNFVKSIWNSIALKDLKSSPDDKRIWMDKAVTSFIDYLTQVNGIVNDKPINKGIQGLLLSNNFASKFDAAKKANKKGTSNYNLALDLLRTEKPAYSKDVKNLVLSKKPVDAPDSNALTQSFKELKVLHPELYKNIVILGHLQSGSADSRISFNKYIPHEDYMSVVKDGLLGITDSTISKRFVETNMFIKNNWNNNDLVPVLKFNKSFQPIKLPDLNSNILVIPVDKYGASNPAVKVKTMIDPKTGQYSNEYKSEESTNNKFKKSIMLYKRIEDSEGKPIVRTTADGKQKVHIFRQINALGDGNNLQEYYQDNSPSVRDRHFKITEDTNSDVLKHFDSAMEKEASKPVVVNDGFKWARTADNNYEVSTDGDKRFSALNAKLADGRTIEEAYQLDIKGYRSQGNDWRLGKGKPPLNKMTMEESYQAYKNLWRQFLKENPNLEQDLKEKAKGKTLTDKYATTSISQARALSELLNESNNNEKAKKELEKGC